MLNRVILTRSRSRKERGSLRVRVQGGQNECRHVWSNCIAPAIANAIYAAVGIRIKDMPATPEKILEAINTGIADSSPRVFLK